MAWAHAMQAGCEGVMALGGAQPGDRTMLDALLPAGTHLLRQRAMPRRSARMLAAATAGADATRHGATPRARKLYRRAGNWPSGPRRGRGRDMGGCPPPLGTSRLNRTGRRTAASQFAAIPGAGHRLTIGVMGQAIRARGMPTRVPIRMRQRRMPRCARSRAARQILPGSNILQCNIPGQKSLLASWPSLTMDCHPSWERNGS
jgi:hypothetical protein